MGACVATPVTSLCTFVNMCVHVVTVAIYVCVRVLSLCEVSVRACLKVYNHTYIYVQVHSCIYVCVVCAFMHACFVHVGI